MPDETPKPTDDCASCPVCTMRDAIYEVIGQQMPTGDAGIPLDAMTQIMAHLMSAGTRDQQDKVVEKIVERLRQHLAWYRQHPEACISKPETEH